MTTPVFNPAQMRALVRRDRFLSLAFDQVRRQISDTTENARDERALRVLFNTYVADDSTMAAAYEAVTYPVE